MSEAPGKSEELDEQEQRIAQYDLWRFKRAQRDALAALKERDAAQERLDKANAVLNAFRTLVGSRGMLPDGESTNPYSDVSDIDPTGVSSDPELNQAIATDLVSEKTARVFAKNKTDFVRVVLARAGSVGMTPAEIRKAAEKAGFPIARGYPYSVIQKLKAKDEIEERAPGRYTYKKRGPRLF